MEPTARAASRISRLVRPAAQTTAAAVVAVLVASVLLRALPLWASSGALVAAGLALHVLGGRRWRHVAMGLLLGLVAWLLFLLWLFSQFGGLDEL